MVSLKAARSYRVMCAHGRLMKRRAIALWLQRRHDRKVFVAQPPVKVLARLRTLPVLLSEANLGSTRWSPRIPFDLVYERDVTMSASPIHSKPPTIMSTVSPTNAENRRIALLEDNVAHARVVRHWLESAGYDTIVEHDGRRFIDRISQERVDMLLLDWDVPGMTGIDVLIDTRKRVNYLIPMVLLTQHDDERDILHGLASGADDYLVKPINERMLIARVVAQLRKYYPQTQRKQQIEYSGYVLDETARTATLPDGEQIVLPEREFSIALYLFIHAGRVVSREALLKHVWGQADTSHVGTLATYITRARNWLRLRPNGLRISSVYRYGYRLEHMADAADNDLD
nr:response regulator transcription factor [Burkholderia dolosa]